VLAWSDRAEQARSPWTCRSRAITLSWCPPPDRKTSSAMKVRTCSGWRLKPRRLLPPSAC